MIVRYTVALDRLLDGFVMYPFAELFVLYVPYRAVVLLGESRGEVPRDHHVDIILLALYLADRGEVFFVKAIVEKIVHQAEYAE